MKKPFLLLLLFAFSFAGPKPSHAITETELADVYHYANLLYLNKKFDQAKDIFKKIALSSGDPTLNANSLYYYSQCCFMTKDFEGCVKALTILAKKWPQSNAIQKGYVNRFANFVINQVSLLQVHWDYYRYMGYNEDGKEVWKESIPPGFKVKKINFKLGFGLYRVLDIINPNAKDTKDAKDKLEVMLNMPITMVWVDEKPATNRFGHPADFLSIFSVKEKKIFSKIICERMFFDWSNDKLYQFFLTYDDVRNLKQRYVARTKAPIELSNAPSAISGTILPTNASVVAGAPATIDAGPPMSGSPEDDLNALNILTSRFTLARLFKLAGYDPYKDVFKNVVDAATTDLNL